MQQSGRFTLFAAVLLSVAVGACGGAPEPDAEPTPQAPQAAAPRLPLADSSTASPVEGQPEVPGAQWVEGPSGATLRGLVRLTGAPPEPTTLNIDKNTDVCGQAVEARTVVLGDGGALAHVVVSLKGVTYAGGAPMAEVLIDNKACRFEPHVLAAKVGDTLAIGNSDPILHNTHAYLGNTEGETVFNVALPLQGQTLKKPLKKAGIYNVRCDAGHWWMQAYIYVADHPWVAVSDATGAFEIAHIPPGTYAVEAWHESLGTREATITLGSGETGTLDFSFEAG